MDSITSRADINDLDRSASHEETWLMHPYALHCIINQLTSFDAASKSSNLGFYHQKNSSNLADLISSNPLAREQVRRVEQYKKQVKKENIKG